MVLWTELCLSPQGLLTFFGGRVFKEGIAVINKTSNNMFSFPFLKKTFDFMFNVDIFQETISVFFSSEFFLGLVLRGALFLCSA